MTPQRPGRPRDPSLDTAILDAALRLFATGGLPAVSFEAIAERTGAARSSIYRRWRTREDLLLAAIDRLRTELEAGVEDWAERPLREVLSTFTRLTVAASRDRLSLGLLRQVLALDSGHPIKRRYWSGVIEPRRRTFAAMVLAARRAGELPPGPEPELLQDLLAGGIAYRLLMHPEPLEEAQAEAHVRDVLMAIGLGSDGISIDGRCAPQADTQRGRGD